MRPHRGARRRQEGRRPAPDRSRAARGRPDAARGARSAQGIPPALLPEGDGNVVTAEGKVLIVNADDFGLTAGVSRGILEAARRAIVTVPTLLVNRDIPPAQVEELQASALGVGVHLNL